MPTIQCEVSDTVMDSFQKLSNCFDRGEMTEAQFAGSVLKLGILSACERLKEGQTLANSPAG